MEEKERYELFGEHVIKDNDDNAKCQLLDTYKTYVILNQQYKENQQLKQQLHDLPKKIVEEIRKLCCIEDKLENGEYLLGLTQKDLDTILKKYGWENE